MGSAGALTGRAGSDQMKQDRGSGLGQGRPFVPQTLLPHPLWLTKEASLCIRWLPSLKASKRCSALICLFSFWLILSRCGVIISQITKVRAH